MPDRQAATPSPHAATNVPRNDRVSCCAVATGTTISALTSSSPTVRIATVTVTAAITAISTLSARTGNPATRANSSSWQTANSCGASPTAVASTATASTTTTHRSVPETVVSEPNRYVLRVAAP